MSVFTQYLQYFTKETEDPKLLTHLAFRGKGKYNVPNTEYERFYETYYKGLVSNESMYLIEKINETTKFAFFLDIEVPKRIVYKIKSIDISMIIDTVADCMKNMFDNADTRFIITRRNDNYHVNYYNIVVNSFNAQRLAKFIVTSLPNEQKRLIDTSVYRTGLRLFGSKKSEGEIAREKSNYEGDLSDYSSVYEIYDMSTNELFDIGDTTFDDFMKLVIRRKEDVELLMIKTSFKDVQDSIKSIPVKSVDNTEITKEVTKLLNYMGESYHEHLANYELKITRIVAAQSKQGIYCHYVTVSDRCCPFVGREHKRAQSPIYIEISINGVYIKCYDEDCLKRRYPDEGFRLPSNFEIEYPELYLSMTSKYWKSDITITSDIKQLLEDSLCGSHYKIAKVIYNIYKARFRIDDIKNPDWYEFDGARWSKTHIMNILISEELQKYYKGIKISDTASVQDETESDDKVANMRNSLIDNIIGKLENVSFKKNIMSEMHFLFKSLEPNFLAKLDANPYLIGFKNGVYDLKENVFRNGNPNDYLTLSTGYDNIEYDESLPEVQDIYAFLSQIIPNLEMLVYLLKVLGRSLLGINDEQFYIFTGLSGANGKSTLINFLEYTLGDYMTAADVSLLTNNRALSSSASPDIIRLKGRRLVSFAEPEYGDTLKTGIIKAFSGGDSIIARELYKAPISFKLQASMFMCCNDLPAINSIDGGCVRRLRIIEFKSRFCDKPTKANEFKIDPTIKDKIKGWRPYFMSILIHHYKLYQEEVEKNGKVAEPEEVKIATNKYKADNDKFDEFINEHIKEDTYSFETLKNIYSNMMRWWSSNYPTTKTPDIKELRKSLKIKFGEEVERRTSGGIKQVGFNIILTDQMIDDDIDDEKDY